MSDRQSFVEEASKLLMFNEGAQAVSESGTDQQIFSRGPQYVEQNEASRQSRPSADVGRRSSDQLSRLDLFPDLRRGQGVDWGQDDPRKKDPESRGLTVTCSL
jgi:hypothetical protein